MQARTILRPGVLLAGLSTGLLLSAGVEARGEARPDEVVITRTHDALELARENDTAIDYYRSEEALARRTLEDLSRVRMPTVQAAISSSQNRVQHQADAHGVEVQVAASMPLYDGGRRAARRNAASAELGILAIQREEHEAQRAKGVVELLAAYDFAVQAAHIEQQHYRRSQLELEARAHDHELGLLTDYEFRVMELSVERAALEAEARRSAAEDLRTRLRLVLGLAEPVALTIHPTFSLDSGLPLLRNDFGFLLSAALRSDATIRRLRFERDRTVALLDAAPRALSPVVEGTAGLSMRGDPLPLTSPALRFDLRVSWPALRSGSLGIGGGVVFDAGNTASRALSVQTGSSTRRQSQATLTRRRMDATQAESALEQGERALEIWIRSTIRDYAHLSTVLAADREASDLAALLLVRTRRDAADGRRRATAVLDAEYNLAQARMAELETAFEIVQLYQQLQFRTGLAQP